MLPTETLFMIFNTGVLLPWLLLFFAPRSTWTQQMVQKRWPIIILAAVYLSLLLIDFFTATDKSINFMSFESIKAAFGREEVLLIGWIHYLTFDLFIGMWEFRDAEKRKIPHYFLLPCLIFTLMDGPVGLLLYFILQRFYPYQETIAAV